MSNRTLLNKVRKLKELETQQKELDKAMAAIKAEIQKEMDSQNTEQMTAGDYIIRWTKVVSNRFNSKAFALSHKRLYNQYTNAVESRRFTIA